MSTTLALRKESSSLNILSPVFKIQKETCGRQPSQFESSTEDRGKVFPEILGHGMHVRKEVLTTTFDSFIAKLCSRPP